MDTQTGAPGEAVATEVESAEYLSEPELTEAEERRRLAYAIALGRRIKQLRGETARTEFASKLGVHANTIGKFERGGSMPDAYLCQRMCELKGQSIEWLITGHHQEESEPERSVTAVEHGKYVFVPLFDIQASAGHGAFNDVEKVVAMHPFHTDYIRSELHIAHNDIALLGIAGSSSEPVLRSGDTVMVDRRDRDVRAEGLHLLLMDDALLVKQVQRLPGRVLRVSSSNDRYPPFEMKLDEESQANVDIVGRVRWGGVTFH
ncbi:MAG: putative phage repressor [Polaromonas sp.]|nr:putative phage repressor [Polaromonas sp.]